jgi:hypothetical protein
MEGGEHMSVPRPYLGTAIGAILAVPALGITWLAHVDLLDQLVLALQRLQAGQLDETLAALGLLGVGFGFDVIRRGRYARRQVEMQELRFRVVKTTIRTAHGIVKDSLAGLQRIRPEVISLLPATTVTHFDALIEATEAHLRTLDALATTPDRDLTAGTPVDALRPSAEPRP